MWLRIRQGLVLVFWILFVIAVLSASIYVRSGAVSTIFGYP